MGDVGLPSAIRACTLGDIVLLPRGDSSLISLTSLTSSGLSESEKLPITLGLGNNRWGQGSGVRRYKRMGRKECALSFSRFHRKCHKLI